MYLHLCISNIKRKEETKMKKEFTPPKAPIINADGNIFNLMGIASRSLKDHGYHEQAKEMVDRITSSHSYDEALGILTEYIEPCSEEEIDFDDDIDYLNEMEYD